MACKGKVDFCDLSNAKMVGLRAIMEIMNRPLPDGCKLGSREVARRRTPVLLTRIHASCHSPLTEECNYLWRAYGYYTRWILKQNHYKPYESRGYTSQSGRQRLGGQRNEAS